MHSIGQMAEILEVAEAADILPIVMYSEKPSPEVVMEMHDPDVMEELLSSSHDKEIPEILDAGDIQIVIDELPGVEKLDPEFEETLEVHDDETVQSNATQLADNNEAKKSKRDPKWDWESTLPHGFVGWIKTKLDEVPKHSGKDTAGIERAISFMDRLDNEISKAMRGDLEGQLDANKIEEVRAQIDDGIERLHVRLDLIKSKKGKRKKKAEEQSGMVKEAQKATNITGIVITVDLLISRIARACINGMVSAGHDIEDIFEKQAKYYELDKREKAMTMQLLSDMGYPLRQDRGLPIDEDVDMTSTDNVDWAANYVG